MAINRPAEPKKTKPNKANFGKTENTLVSEDGDRLK